MNQNPGQTAVGCGSGSGVGYLCTYVCMYNKYNKPYNAYIYVMDV